MSAREIVYGLLALLGLGGTMYYNVQYAIAQGGAFSLMEFIRFGLANPASSSLTVDVLVAFVVFLVWVIPEAKRVGMRAGWAYALVGFVTAFAFAFPLFLMLRERHLRRRPPAP